MLHASDADAFVHACWRWRPYKTLLGTTNAGKTVMGGGAPKVMCVCWLAGA